MTWKMQSKNLNPLTNSSTDSARITCLVKLASVKRPTREGSRDLVAECSERSHLWGLTALVLLHENTPNTPSNLMRSASLFIMSAEGEMFSNLHWTNQATVSLTWGKSQRCFDGFCRTAGNYPPFETHVRGQSLPKDLFVLLRLFKNVLIGAGMPGCDAQCCGTHVTRDLNGGHCAFSSVRVAVVSWNNLLSSHQHQRPITVWDAIGCG